MSGAGLLLALRGAGGWISGAFAWLLRHPWQAALIVAAAWLSWLHLVTLPGKDAAIAEREQTIAEREDERNQERAAHQQTKQAYAAAQLAARELEEKRLVRVAAEQQEITDAINEDYQRRLADARAAAERLRSEALRAGDRAAGSAGDLRLPGAGGAAGGAAEAAGDRRLPLSPAEIEWRLIATEQAIQLDELISWVEQQAAVNINEGQ